MDLISSIYSADEINKMQSMTNISVSSVPCNIPHQRGVSSVK
jgi:hypothetical protein